MMYGVSFPMSQEAMSDNFLIPIGKCKVEREGSDVTIVAHSKMVTHSLEAADALAKEGVKAEVINLRSIRPLDIDTIIKSVKKTNRFVGTFLLHIAIYLTRTDWLSLRVASPPSALVVKSVPRLWKVRHLTISMRQSRESLVLMSPRP
jgi:hypothetical protein